MASTACAMRGVSRPTASATWRSSALTMARMSAVGSASIPSEAGLRRSVSRPSSIATILAPGRPAAPASAATIHFMEIGARRLKGLISEHHYLSVFLSILAVKILVWGWSLGVSHWVPVTTLRYFAGGHHYQMDPRITEGRVDFLSIWIYADAEWYLSIAGSG